MSLTQKQAAQDLLEQKELVVNTYKINGKKYIKCFAEKRIDGKTKELQLESNNKEKRSWVSWSDAKNLSNMIDINIIRINEQGAVINGK